MEVLELALAQILSLPLQLVSSAHLSSEALKFASAAFLSGASREHPRSDDDWRGTAIRFGGIGWRSVHPSASLQFFFRAPPDPPIPKYTETYGHR